MSQGFHTLKVISKTEETADASAIYFEIPTELTIEFQYTAGQYLTFEAEINGEAVRRSYSLCTAPGIDAYPGVAVKRVEDGRMSNWMNNELKVGSTIDVMPPMGKFTVIPDTGRTQHYVLWAGGSGITPMLGIAKTLLSKDPNSTISLVYANRDPKSVIFKNTWDELQKSSNGRLNIFYSYDKAPLTWFGLKGLLSPDKVESIQNQKVKVAANNCEHYICGPGGMMEAVKQGLAAAGAPSAQVHTEYFSAPTTKKEVEILEAASFDGKASITLTVFGETHTVPCDQNTTVLKAAMKKGINPPYSCTVGVCTTCRAKVHKGELYMLEREGLSDDEIAEGYVLTCQAVPRSAEIELTFE